MWAVFVFIGYLVLALVIPVSLALSPVWRRTRAERQIACPGAGTALIALDPWYAMRMHITGGPELRVRRCSRWPGNAGCGQECLPPKGA